LGSFERQRLGDARQRSGFLPGQHPQRLAPHLERVGRLDLLGDGQVIGRLGVMYVDYGSDPDRHVATREGEQLFDCVLFRHAELVDVLRGERGEIRRRHAQDEILPGAGELVLGTRGVRLALLVAGEVLFAIERLGEREAVAGGRIAVVGVEARRLHVLIGLAAPGGEVDGGQQPGAPLRFLLASGVTHGAGRGKTRIVLLRLPVDVEQVFGIHRRGKRHEHGQQGSGTHRSVP
jgi:hypothetical protein